MPLSNPHHFRRYVKPSTDPIRLGRGVFLVVLFCLRVDRSNEELASSSTRPILEVIGLTILAFVVATVVGVMFIIPLVALGYDVQTTFVLVGATGVGQLAMFALGYGYFRYQDLRIPISIPTLGQVGYVLGGVLLALLAATGLSILLVTLNLLPGSVIGEIATTNPTYLLGLAALSVVLVVPIEEFLFRGVIQGRLRELFGPLPAIAGSSLLFGSMHLANYSGRGTRRTGYARLPTSRR